MAADGDGSPGFEGRVRHGSNDPTKSNGIMHNVKLSRAHRDIGAGLHPIRLGSGSRLSLLEAGRDPKPVEPIARGVRTIPGHGGSVVDLFATSQDGALLYAPEVAPQELDTLLSVDHEVREEEIVSSM